MKFLIITVALLFTGSAYATPDNMILKTPASMLKERPGKKQKQRSKCATNMPQAKDRYNQTPDEQAAVLAFMQKCGAQ
jgi:hypothetical protein